jgi:hypothetical protein
MEGYCSTGQSPQRAVVPMEEEEEEEEEEDYFNRIQRNVFIVSNCKYSPPFYSISFDLLTRASALSG